MAEANPFEIALQRGFLVAAVAQGVCQIKRVSCYQSGIAFPRDGVSIAECRLVFGTRVRPDRMIDEADALEGPVLAGGHI